MNGIKLGIYKVPDEDGKIMDLHVIKRVELEDGIVECEGEKDSVYYECERRGHLYFPTEIKMLECHLVKFIDGRQPEVE